MPPTKLYIFLLNGCLRASLVCTLAVNVCESRLIHVLKNAPVVPIQFLLWQNRNTNLFRRAAFQPPFSFCAFQVATSGPSTLSKLPRRRNSQLSRAFHAAQHEERKVRQREEKVAERKRKEAVHEEDQKAREEHISRAIREAEKVRKQILADRAAKEAAQTQQLAAVQKEEIDYDDVLQIQEESQDEIEHVVLATGPKSL
ncbi:hypothetical protein GHT06_000234 [Daphnia sinensis]|uniref:EOG090X0FQ9 n=1 Tax=Daphnia sinensis TaxID=1820382 RepID=A0AAD5KW67_9CRUS|nr:hypothetical protein GHT06_000234 [Daphnia sinensis]